MDDPDVLLAGNKYHERLGSCELRSIDSQPVAHNIRRVKSGVVEPVSEKWGRNHPDLLAPW